MRSGHLVGLFLHRFWCFWRIYSQKPRQRRPFPSRLAKGLSALLDQTSSKPITFVTLRHWVWSALLFHSLHRVLQLAQCGSTWPVRAPRNFLRLSGAAFGRRDQYHCRQLEAQGEVAGPSQVADSRVNNRSTCVTTLFPVWTRRLRLAAARRG